MKESNPQLPIHWYFDPRISDLERRLLFDAGPGYVGHELMVPNTGDHYVLDWQDRAHVLVRNASGIELLSNVCRHRQATLLEGRGNVRSIVCPLHRWAYGLDGRLLSAPHFPERPCLDLDRKSLENWNGLLFSGPRHASVDLAHLGCIEDLSFSGYKFVRSETTEYQFNWKTFIEVYLEDYHVEPFHPGLRNFVDCREVQWEMGQWYNVQTVPIKRGLQRAGTPVYREWQKHILAQSGGVSPKLGAIWLLYYPNIMVEWYPYVLIVSTVIPRSADSCSNVVEFYFPEHIVEDDRDLVEAECRAYNETALEDQLICDRMTHGRRTLYQRGLNQFGPYQTPMEDGLRHFHEFLRGILEPHLF